MHFSYDIESILIALITVLCTILFCNVLHRLRLNLPYRVNCWFCNYNSWIKFPDRNSWTCKNCDQYNGFTKDGDYNKPITTTTEAIFKTPKSSHRFPPTNGLCKMCNINQQLKVMQLANFVPMNVKKFDDEIEGYRLQLEKAYKLCSPCRKVLQTKLHREKETLLGSKLIQSRTPEKKSFQKENNKNKRMRNIINCTSVIIAGILLFLVSVELFKGLMKSYEFSSTINNSKEIICSLLQRLFMITESKAFMTFPKLENYISFVYNILNLDFDLFLTYSTNYFNSKSFDNANDVAQKAMGGAGCILQIIAHLLNVNALKYAIIFDLLWSIFVIMSLVHHTITVNPTLMCLIKIICSSSVVLIAFQISKTKKTFNAKIQSPPKRMKNLINGKMNLQIEDEDTSAVETDDDVSLCKFGVHNYTDSSNETLNMFNNSLVNGRAFTPRNNDSIWNKSRSNPTFCVNSVLTKPPSVASDNLFVKPTFNKYQKLVKDESDSDLDESISCLNIGSPKKPIGNAKSIFSLRKFTPTPSFVAPIVSPFTHPRPLISPSKLGHSTSWVAGGYWGSDGNRHIFNINGSRSSSQSSGFESQTSSLNQRNVMSLPPSREESVCGESDRTVLDRFQNCNMNYGNGVCQIPQNFSHVGSPIYPRMKYDSHVHIPQPRFGNSMQCQNMYSTHNYSQQGNQYVDNNNMFKTPGGSSLIRLPQLNTFSSH